jgi:uncharacterized protein YjiS (DUF1127 family)
MSTQTNPHGYGGYSRQTSLVEACTYRAREALAAFRLELREWQRRIRIRHELTTLSDRDLNDIRWTRAEVEAEARKPFWRA